MPVALVTCGGREMQKSCHEGTCTDETSHHLKTKTKVELSRHRHNAAHKLIAMLSAFARHKYDKVVKSLVLTSGLVRALFVCLHPPYGTQFRSAFVPANL